MLSHSPLHVLDLLGCERRLIFRSDAVPQILRELDAFGGTQLHKLFQQHLVHVTPRKSRYLAGGGKLARQRVGPLRDVAGAETHHDVARKREAPNDAREVLRTVERNNLAMAARA